MKHTTIVEPTGLDPRNVSTPSDLIKLARIAMKNPAVVQIAAMRSLDVPGIDPVSNTNDLLGWNGIDGLKTGTLDGFGSSLLYTSKLDVGLPEPLSVIGVQLGGYSRSAANAEVDTLLTSIIEGFHDVVVAEQSQVVGTYTTVWGKTARMVIGENATLFTWSDTPITSRIEVMPLSTGVDGDRVGTVTYTAGSQSVEVPVLLEGGIKSPDTWWRLTHPGELGD
jgi:D-alanyl-D-alanine carboxypeptidase (penicillin-binding protein 5/6)